MKVPIADAVRNGPTGIRKDLGEALTELDMKAGGIAMKSLECKGMAEVPSVVEGVSRSSDTALLEGLVMLPSRPASILQSVPWDLLHC